VPGWLPAGRSEASQAARALLVLLLLLVRVRVLARVLVRVLAPVG
jgi:hypothetical protein